MATTAPINSPIPASVYAKTSIIAINDADIIAITSAIFFIADAAAVTFVMLVLAFDSLTKANKRTPTRTNITADTFVKASIS